MDLVGNGQWDIFKNLIRQAHDTFNQDTITWYRSRGGLDIHGEDNATERFTVIPLLGLIQYNFFRTWPVTKTTESGELDGESILMILNNRYLEEQGYFTAKGYFDFDPAADKFIHKGITYKASGDSSISQAKEEALLTMVILKREETASGTKQFDD